MLQRFFIVFLLLISSPFASSAFADELFYVELGKVTSKPQADQQWQELLDAHTALLGDLQYHTRDVIHEGRNRYIHLYAGPLEGKDDANKLCAQLFRDKVSCFVVEGLPAQRKKAIEHASSSADLPWLIEDQQKLAEQQKQAALKPWTVTSATRESINDEPVETRIAVAEAVRVPLTERIAMREAASGEAQKHWVVVSSFYRQRDAIDYWKEVREQALDMTVGLRTVIKRPAGKDNYALTIGPLSSQSDAEYLCSMALLPVDSSLSCDVRKDRSAMSAVTARQQSLVQHRQNRQELTAVVAAGYWLQVPITNSFAGAEELWQSMLSEHADLLSGLDYRGVAVTRQGQAIKFGNFALKDDAAQRCYQLKQRQVQCQIFGDL